MKYQRLLLTSLFVMAVSSMSFAGIINPISASVNLSMSSNAGCGMVGDSNTTSWGTTLSTLSTSTNAFAQCTQPNRKVTTSGDLEATWSANTRKGTIKFTNIGWTVNNNVTGGVANGDLGTDYSYTFMPTTEIQFDLSYSTKFTGDLNGYGLNGFFVTLSNNWNTQVGISDSGTLTAILWPGQTYTLNIKNGANICCQIAGLKEHLDGKFHFQATAVPEPTSMLMVGGGILALAGALRKKKNS